jgi:hypothetical protein
MIRPLIGAHLNVMAAAIIRAPDQDAANAGFAHFAEGYFLGAVEHVP